MRPTPVSAASAMVLVAFACTDGSGPSPIRPGRIAALTQEVPPFAVTAEGTYHFVVPADFNGGIFGVEIGNHVSFVARRGADGGVTGRFRYVQTAAGEEFIFSGRVTCIEVYDTPVLKYFENVPPMTHNRAKWGGMIEQSNDPTDPAGTFLWFQSIDNNGEPASPYPDVSPLGGFGDEAANEAFCHADRVPNSMFGPHAVRSGNILVR